MNVDVTPEGNYERQLAMVAFASVFGGGILAYEAMRSIREGDLWKTDEIRGSTKPGIVALGIGGYLGVLSMREAAKEVGWGPILWGGGALTAFVAVARAIRK